MSFGRRRKEAKRAAPLTPPVVPQRHRQLNPVQEVAAHPVAPVRAGARQVSTDASAVLVLSVDQPRSPELVRQVIDAYREKKAPVTYPAYQGRGGHPIIFDGALLPEMARVRESRQGLREVVQRHRARANRFTLDDGAVVDVKGNEEVEYDGEIHTAANLFDALKEGYYGKF